MACCPPFISTCSEIASKFEPRTLHHSNPWNSKGFRFFWVIGFDRKWFDKSSYARRHKALRLQHYEGAKEMLLVDDVEDKEFLHELIETLYNELPAPQKKK